MERKTDTKTLIETLLRNAGVSFEELSVLQVAGHTVFSVRTQDSGALIGHSGETLRALNHIVKKTLENTSSSPDDFRFLIDVNDYHRGRMEALEAQAKTIAERARTFGYDIEMSPMPAFERMIVHESLRTSPDVTTESRGEGPLRHVVVVHKETQ